MWEKKVTSRNLICVPRLVLYQIFHITRFGWFGDGQDMITGESLQPAPLSLRSFIVGLNRRWSFFFYFGVDYLIFIFFRRIIFLTDKIKPAHVGRLSLEVFFILLHDITEHATLSLSSETQTLLQFFRNRRRRRPNSAKNSKITDGVWLISLIRLFISENAFSHNVSCSFLDNIDWEDLPRLVQKRTLRVQKCLKNHLVQVLKFIIA